MSDYYKILEIEKGSDIETIKKAYKKLALKWHPDRNQNRKEEAEKKFKEITEAYEFLSDPENKEFYDKYGRKRDNIPQGNFDPRDIFNQFFGVNTPHGMQFNFPFEEFHHDIPFAGTQRKVHKQKDDDVTHYINCTVEQIYTGITKKFKIKKKDYTSGSLYPGEIEKVLDIDIKPGYKEGTKIRFEKEGDIHPTYYSG